MPFDFQYTLIPLAEISYRMFLSSDQPEARVVALLGNLEGNPIESVARELLADIVQDAVPPATKYQRLNQLRMLSQLRKFDFYKLMDEDIAKDTGVPLEAVRYIREEMERENQ